MYRRDSGYVRGALKGLSMHQRDILAKPYRENDVVRACRIRIAEVLFASNHSVVEELVSLDEGPTDEIEIYESLQDGRIAYPRISPLVDRLKHVWQAKGHFPPDTDKTVELLIGQFGRVPNFLVLAQRKGNEWIWVRG